MFISTNSNKIRIIAQNIKVPCSLKGAQSHFGSYSFKYSQKFESEYASNTPPPPLIYPFWNDLFKKELWYYMSYDYFFIAEIKYHLSFFISSFFTPQLSIFDQNIEDHILEFIEIITGISYFCFNQILLHKLMIFNSFFSSTTHFNLLFICFCSQYYSLTNVLKLTLFNLSS